MQHELMTKLKLDPLKYSAIHPLTPMQRDMYLDALVNPETLLSSHGLVLVFRHGIDVARMCAVLQAMSDKQSILRSQLVPAPEDDSAVAYIAVKANYVIHYDEINFNEPFSQQQNSKAACEFIYRTYSIHHDPLALYRFLKFSDNTVVLLIAMHHSVSDGGSLNIFKKNILQAYLEYPAIAEDTLGEDNFFEFAELNIKQTDSADVIKFWNAQLAHAEPLEFHPHEYQPTPKNTFPFRWLEQAIDEQHSRAIKSFCRKNGITPAIYFKTLYTLLLQHYCRPDADFCIHEAFSIRPLPSHAESQGVYLQQVPFIVNHALFQNTDTTFHHYLQHAKEFQHATKPYRAVSLKLTNEFHPRGRIAFLYNFYHFLKPVEFQQESFKDDGFPSSAEKNVQYIVKMEENNFVQRLLFDPSNFSDLGFLDRIESLSRQIIEQGIEKLTDLRFVSENVELDTLLNSWNNTACDFDLSEPLHRHIEKQAANAPNKIAAIFKNSTLTYQALNEKSNQLAHALIEWGAQPGELIALMSERNLEFVIAAVAILKARAAYVPIDTSYPDERVEYMLTNSSARTILTRSTQIPRLNKFTDKKRFCLDSDWAELATQHCENLTLDYSCKDRAYMIYTSGSTGTPKGAIIRHNGALNHIFAEQKALKLNELNFLQTAPTSSDISVWQFLGPLVTGGTSVILEDVTNIPSLIKHIDQYKINIVELVPVVLTLMLDFISAQPADRSLLPSLKIMMATGEAVPLPLINRWLKYFPNIPITNAYGPTEAADDVIQTSFCEPLPIEKLNVPIGKPLANFKVYILDPYLRLTPIGVVGEICIVGIGVGEGYWDNLERTQQSFIANPYCSENNSNLMYKTGDLGRWTQDGQIEYIDRVDNQIKIRGHRIELGEIETQLAKHPKIRECAATVREDESGNKYIAAYVITMDSKLTASAFKQFLKNRLPAYMLPQHIVILEVFPTTPAGKIDRKNLPVPSSQIDLENHAMPSTIVEKNLANIWSNALKRDMIGLEDNFFDLGGHSVLAIKLLQEIEREFNVLITPTEFMQAENLSVLAQLIQANVQTPQQFSWLKKKKLPPFSAVVPLRSSGNLPPLFCIHGAGGNIFGFHQIAQCMNSNQPFYGVQAQGIDGLRVPLSTVEGMAARYVREIQKITPHGPYYIAGYSAGSVIAVEVAQQLIKQGHKVASMIVIDLELERTSAEKTLEKIRNRVTRLRSRGLRFLLEWAKTRFSWEIWRSYARIMELLRDAFNIPIPLKFRDRYLYEKVASACNNYKAPAYPGVITLLRAKDQDRKTLLPGGGWEKISLQPVEVLEMPGNHHTIFTKPLLPQVAAVLEEALELGRNRKLID